MDASTSNQAAHDRAEIERRGHEAEKYIVTKRARNKVAAVYATHDVNHLANRIWFSRLSAAHDYARDQSISQDEMDIILAKRKGGEIEATYRNGRPL